jgi:4a-hydroxytetrahydrobiopterin dehydratase
MEQLTQMKCTACRKGEPTVTDAEIAELYPQIPDWHIDEREGIKRLERVFKFDNFAHALAFTWWTHKILGLHRNDFIMAAKTDQLYASSDGRPV